jgi:hypothetical protein
MPTTHHDQTSLDHEPSLSVDVYTVSSQDQHRRVEAVHEERDGTKRRG